MKSVLLKLFMMLALALTIFVLPATIGCTPAKNKNQIISPKIVGDWKIESDMGVLTGTIGKIGDKDYLFLVTGQNSQYSIRILNIDNPEKPNQIGELKKSGINPIGIGLSGKTLCLTTMSSLLLVDVSNLAEPKEIIRSAKFPSILIAASGKYAFLGALRGVTVVDILDLSGPKHIATFEVPGGSLSSLKAMESLLLAVASNGVYIFDISTPGFFKQANFFINPNNTQPKDWNNYPLAERDFFFDAAIAGKYAYIASGTSGIRVLDISNPYNALEIANLKTKGVASRILINDKLAYVIDWRKGLLPQNPLPIIIIDISEPAKPVEVGSVEMPSYFNFNFAQSNGYIYYFGNDQRVKIVKVYEKR